MKEKNRLKIAMLGHKRIPSREGGIEVVVSELSTRMVQRGHSVTCFNRSGHHVSGKEFEEKKRREYKGVKLKYVFTLDFRGFAAMTSSISASICAALGKYDIVHFHAEGPCVMIWLPKLLGKRCIATIHGLDHRRKKWGRFARAYIMLGEKMAVRLADEIIVLNKSEQTYFWDTYRRRTRLIPNGVNRSEPAAPEEIGKLFGLKKESYILFLGRLVPEKGVKCLIEAYRQLNTEKKLVIAGGTSDTVQYAEELKRMASGDDRICFTGFVQGRILRELYSNAYMYVLPSEVEGMPLSLLEAMSYGNCCLVSDIPECMTVVEDKGAVFHGGDVNALKEMLQLLCQEEQVVKNYRENAADFICSKYRWDDIVGQTLKLYEGRWTE